MPCILIFIAYLALEMPFVSIGPIFRVYVRRETDDILFILVFITHPTLEIFFVSARPIFHSYVKNKRGDISLTNISYTRSAFRIDATDISYGCSTV